METNLISPLQKSEVEQACPLCHETTQALLTKELRRGSGQVYYCKPCDHGFLINTLQVDSKTYYAEQYRAEYSHNAEVAATHAQELFDIYSKSQTDRLRIIRPFLNPQTSLLEVGASAGQFLAHIQKEIQTVHAIELDPSCVEYLRRQFGIPADTDFLKSSQFKDNLYDVICSFQVMEHVESPQDFLKDLKSCLKPGGVAFVEVPNLHDPLMSVWNVPRYQSFYYHSAHLQYFSEKSLRLVAQDAGFDAKKVSFEFTQDYNVLNHLHWIMNDGPQATCDWGLNEIQLNAKIPAVGEWLTARLRQLNEDYKMQLAKAKCTSNIMMILKN